MTFSDATTGWAVSGNTAGQFLVSRDAGASWSPVKLDTSRTQGGASFSLPTFDGSAGLELATTGTALGGAELDSFTTNDGGDTWTRSGQFVPPDGAGSQFLIQNVSIVDSAHAFAVLEPHHFVVTSDGGSSWTEVQPGSTPPPLGLFDFTTSNMGWAYGSGRSLLTTETGGQEWVDITPSLLPGQSEPPQPKASA